jgi:DNA polymerase elongation subunit (family B)
MSVLVFDIETLGRPPETFDEAQTAYLFRGVETAEARTEEINRLNLSPLTAEVLAIGMLNPDTGGGRVLFRSDRREKFQSEDGKVEFLSGDESAILGLFWDDVRNYDRFVTFNGRTFDCPFLMLRSALLGIRPGRNLVPYRYSATPHCDLLDQLTWYGSTRRFNLDFYCRAFGIPSPKAGGITGLDLGPLYREGKYREIARYCIGDVIATAELYRRWKSLLEFK